MTHYSNKSSRVRISLFKSGGKWYEDGSIDMKGLYDGCLIQDALLKACNRSYLEFENKDGEGWPLSGSPEEWLADGGIIVCLDPYHEHSHPIMLKR